MKARIPELCIDELLLLCTTEGGPDGLDTAIDILSKTKGVILDYGEDYLRRDVASWTPDSDRAYKPNDDHWYVLLRSVARAEVDPKARLRFIICCAGAQSRGIREGVVEALGDLVAGKPKETIAKAKDVLKRLAKHDPEPYIQKIAGEALADLES